MTKQLISNYTFSVAGKTITLTDFTTIRLDRIRLITDVTTNKILYNFADSTIATATVATNVITLSALQGGEANTDKLQIDYDGLTGDPTYDTPVLPNGAATAANQATGNTSLAAIKADVDKIPAQGAAAKAASLPVTIATDQPAVPISAASLPLPTGAAQDGTDISTPTAMPAGGAGIRGWLSAIWTKLNGSLAVTGTFFQATQPASIADGSQVTLGSKADAKSTATDTTAVTVMQVLKEISAMEQAPASRAVTNAGTFAVQATLAAETTKIIGAINNLPATVDTNSGVKSASTLRVVLATDQPALTNKLLVTPDSVALPLHQSVNLDQIAGAALALGQAAKAASLPVTLASDQGAVIAGQTDTFGTTTALTITLASLANSAAGVGRQSTLITGNTARSAMVAVKVKMGTTPTANSLVYVYLIRGDGTLNDDGAGATDAGLTVVNAGLLGTLLCSAATTGLVLTGLFDTKILGSLGKSWGIAIVNNSGVALDATGANHVAEYTLMT